MRVIGLCLLFLLMTGCSFGEVQQKEVVPEYKEELVELGYSEDVIQKLEEKLSSRDLDVVTEYDYVDVLLEIVEDKDFLVENLSKYLDYYENGMNGKAVVYIVNHDIHYTYNEKLVNIMNDKYFIARNLDRYMQYDSENAQEVVTAVNANLDRPFYTDIQSTDISKGILLITNKYYQLGSDYVSPDLVTMSTAYSNKTGQKLHKEAYEAFQKMVDDGEKDGVHIRNLSAYRSYNTQSGLYNNYKNTNGEEWADKWSARPGHSEHQTGLALDVTVKGRSTFDNFEETEEFAWLQEHAYQYGFILRYPEDKTNITGYGYEPWHYRYVGVDVASYIYENKITYEEYYAYFVDNEE